MALKQSFSEFERLQESQAQLFASIEKATQFLWEDAPISAVKAKGRLAYIETLWGKCRVNHDQLLHEADADLRNRHPYFTQHEFDSKEISFLERVDALNEIIDAQQQPPPAHPVASFDATSAAIAASSRSMTQVPKITLPRFSGSYAEWQTFQDYFSTLIIDDSSFTDLQRLHYLKSCLDGEAARLLKNKPTTAANFQVAWNELKARYANEFHLVSTHLSQLFAIPAVSRESAAELRRLVDATNDAIQALTVLGRPVDHWDDLLVHLTVSRLDKVTSKSWKLSLGASDKYPNFQQLKDFLTTQIRALEAVDDNASHHSTKSSTHKPKNSNTRLTSPSRIHHTDTVNTKSCVICNQSHTIYTCPTLNQTPVDKRFELIKRHSLCTNCLSSVHQTKSCKSTRSCRYCNKRHHSLLHKSQTERSETQNSSPESVANANTLVQVHAPSASAASNHFADTVKSSHVILATAWVLVSGASQNSAKVRALLDQGSTHTLVTQSLIQALGCSTYPVDTTLTGVGDVAAGKVSRVAPITLMPLHGRGPALTTDALVVSKLTSYSPKFRYPLSEWPHLSGLSLADNDPLSNAPVHIIIGADLYAYTLRGGLRRGKVGQPVAQDTIFGWILSGGTGHTRENVTQSHSHVASTLDSLTQSIERFWATEEIPHAHAATEDDARCEQHFLKTVSRTKEGRYVVRIPFTVSPPLPVGQSRDRADRLLLNLEHRLEKKPQEREMYVSFMKDYRIRSHMSLMTEVEVQDDQVIYLPHHPVFKCTSTTTKLRVVYNASSLMSNSKSLNDLQFIGPKLQAELPLIISRWRSYEYVCTADIEKMYRQILVHEDDRRYQCIRWRDSRSDPIQSYKLNTVTYGTASAPFLAQRVLKQLAIDEGDDFPMAVPVIRDCFYVDDCLFGAHNIPTARSIRDQVISLLHRGAFELRKWASNTPDLLDGISRENHGHAIERVVQPDDSIKILGLVWKPVVDSYRPAVQCEPLTVITKRTVLSAIAKLYDPMGWFSPVVISAKIFMQTLWKSQLDWDQELPEPLANAWTEYYDSLWCLTDRSIPRWTHQGPDALSTQLHGFSDASTKACAAVVYLRTAKASGEVQMSLLLSKTKVAPLKEMTVPRLELSAAVLLARLIKSLQSLPEYANLPVYCWSDSSIVLAWLSHQSSKWKVFVANRVAEVHSALPNVRWRHVSGSGNPADVASRGVSPRHLLHCSLWFEGPPWLLLPENTWPSTDPPAPDAADLETRAVVLTCSDTSAPLDFASRFSSWTRLLRVTAWILRWLTRVRSSQVPPSDILTSAEIVTAKATIVRTLQSYLFSTDIAALTAGIPLSRSSPVLSLNPYLDNEGLLRVAGRLSHLGLPETTKHPLILKVHPITRLIARHAHEKCLHGGLSLTLSTLRTEFWVLQAKKIVRSTLYHCVLCTRIKADVGQQLMGSLPLPRIQRPERAFFHTGVDYAGPMSVRYAGGRGVKSHPAYLAVFVCMATKAIHLEVVSDYTAAAFLAAYHRFCARRGPPSHLYSDRGTNFQGAERELRRAFLDATSSSELQNRLATDSVTWHFIPPAAPHFGGLWEAGVKSAKSHLKKILKGRTPTFEELATIAARVEACLNSRPLAPLTDNPESLDVLTPAHFLIGASMTTAPEPTLLDTSISRLSRWQAVNHAVQLLWKRWSRDYVLSLQHRSKWKLASTPIQVGQMVLLASDTLPPTKWNLGRVTEVYPGTDGLIRVVKVRTATSEYLRSIRKLALLPVVHEPGATISSVASDR